MQSDPALHAHSNLRHFLAVLARRKWLVALPLLIVPAAALALSASQEPLYRASAEVLLSRQNLAASLTGTEPQSFIFGDATRMVETQAKLARVRTLLARVLRAAGYEDRSVSSFKKRSDVSADRDIDILTFLVTDTNTEVAEKLATEYARQFTIYRRELDTASIRRALGEVQQRLRSLERNAQRGQPIYATLVDKEQLLRTMEALGTSNALLVQPAAGAIQVQPKPVQNAVLGAALGLLLGLVLAFLWDALDTRVRSVDEVAERLDLPLLARLPAPPRRLRASNRLVMLSDQSSANAEAFRMLRTNLEFVNLDRGAKTLMVTSAVKEEGKSTTISNLAIALARAGQRVILVDLDFRRPSIADFFRLQGRPGITNVALGTASLDAAIARIAFGGAHVDRQGGNGAGEMGSHVDVLPAGPSPPNAGEFVGTATLAAILAELRERADFVLIDAPPLLSVGDAMLLSARVDGLLIVTRLNTLRRPMLTELRRSLDTSPTRALGFIVTGAEFEEGYLGGYADYGAAEAAVARAEPAQT